MTLRSRIAQAARRRRRSRCLHQGDWEITFAQHMNVADLRAVLCRCPDCKLVITARAKPRAQHLAPPPSPSRTAGPGTPRNAG